MGNFYFLLGCCFPFLLVEGKCVLFYNVEHIYDTYPNGLVAWTIWLAASDVHLTTVRSMKRTLTGKIEKKTLMKYHETWPVFAFSFQSIFCSCGKGTMETSNFHQTGLKGAVCFLILHLELPMPRQDACDLRSTLVNCTSLCFRSCTETDRVCENGCFHLFLWMVMFVIAIECWQAWQRLKIQFLFEIKYSAFSLADDLFGGSFLVKIPWGLFIWLFLFFILSISAFFHSFKLFSSQHVGS